LDITSKYRTIKNTSEGFFKDKGSKFFAFAYQVYTEEEIKEKQAILRKEYYNAKHHVFAWRLGVNKKAFRANDDGEPTNSSGQPILGQIQSYDLTNVLIVVIRFFGGTKLGIPGLINAYRTAAKDAIENSEIIEKEVQNYYQLEFKYENLNFVMKTIKENNIEPLNQNFDTKCILNFNINIEKSEHIENIFNNIKDLKINHINTK